MNNNVIYFDCFAGVAGDMLVGSLLDLGVDFEYLRSQLAKLPLEGYQITHTKLNKQGICASKFSVDYEPQKKHRHLKDLVALVNAANYSPYVTQSCLKIFENIALAEAKVHGTTKEKVHFHEVGAIDSIIDVCASVICLEYLGVPNVLFSPLPLGNGFVECEHGTIPVPAPATLELLRGQPIQATDLQGEMSTPTGVAILISLGQCLSPMPSLQVHSIGYGAGTRDMSIPNAVRAILGLSQSQSQSEVKELESLLLLETNIDDYQPETIPLVVENLLALGALDVDYHSIAMKKGRSGLKLSVLITPNLVSVFETALFTQLPTLGIKRIPILRRALERKFVDVSTEFGPIKVKLGYNNGNLITYAPEFENVKEVSNHHNIPARIIYDLAKYKTLELIDKGVIR